MTEIHEEIPTVVVPVEPTWKQVLAGAKELDLWSDHAFREHVDADEMAKRVYRRMVAE